MIGRDLVEAGGPTRWIIDFGQRDTFAARSYKLPFERVKEHVMPDVIGTRRSEKKSDGKGEHSVDSALRRTLVAIS